MPSKQNPQQSPAGGSVISAKLRSEVALSAEQQGDGVLVLQLIRSAWLGKRGRRLDDDSARVLLVQFRPADVGRESKVLDRGPDHVATDDPDVEVGVADAGPTKQTGQTKFVRMKPPTPSTPQSVVLARVPYCNAP